MDLSNDKIVIQNKRADNLIKQFKEAIECKNLGMAKTVMVDLQSVLRTLNKTTSLIEFKNHLYELALNNAEYDLAIEGFKQNRKLVNKKTRIYLEATALLAIGYLRTSNLLEAQPLIKEVLQNKKFIKTERTRLEFNIQIIERFDEECALFSLRSEKEIDLDLNEVHKSAIDLSKDSTTEQIFFFLGNSLPKSTKELLFEVDQFSKKQLTYKEQKLLPSSENVIENIHAGKTVYSAFKRVVYNSLCDPNSEVYKGWFTNGIGSLIDKKFISGAVIATLSGFKIGHIALAISGSALLIRFGVDVYCEKYKPIGVMEIRKQKSSIKL